MQHRTDPIQALFVSRCSVENWSLTRTLAHLAAVFAIVTGTLMPFAAMAAAQPGQPIVICTTQGLQTIHNGGFDGPLKHDVGAKCAACIMPLQADLPPVPVLDVAPRLLKVTRVAYVPFIVAAPPPARGPPRPPSTAPPHA